MISWHASMLSFFLNETDRGKGEGGSDGLVVLYYSTGVGC